MTGPRPLVVLLLAEMLLARAATAQTTRPAIARPTTPLDGWKPAVDPADLKAKPRFDVRLTIPIKHQTRCVVPTRPSPFVLVLTVIETARGGETVDAFDLPEAAEKNSWGSKPKGMAFSLDGLELAAYCEHGHNTARLLIWDLATGQVMTDQTGEMAKDDRWARAERRFEYFGNPRFLRFSNNVIDRQSGKAVFTIPPSKPGRTDDLVKALGDDRVLVVSEKDQDKAWVSAAMLPKAGIDKSLVVVRTGGKSTDAGLPPLSKPNYSGVRVALDAAGPDVWSLKPDAPAKVGPVAGAGAIALRPLHPPGGDHVAIARICFSGAPANQLAGGASAGSFEFPQHAQDAGLGIAADQLTSRPADPPDRRHDGEGRPHRQLPRHRRKPRAADRHHPRLRVQARNHQGRPIPLAGHHRRRRPLVDEINANPGHNFYTTVPIPGALAKPLGKLNTSKVTLKGVIPAPEP